MLKEGEWYHQPIDYFPTEKSLNFSYKYHEVSLRIHFTLTKVLSRAPTSSLVWRLRWLQSHFQFLSTPPSSSTYNHSTHHEKFAVSQSKSGAHTNLFNFKYTLCLPQDLAHLQNILFHVLLYFRSKWPKAQLWIPPKSGLLGAPRPTAFSSASPWSFHGGKE